MSNITTCGHDGPHYRINPKGRPGIFWCEWCIREKAPRDHKMTRDLAELCRLLQDNLAGGDDD